MPDGVEFTDEFNAEEDKLFTPRKDEYARFSFVKLVIQLRLARTESQANIVLICISVLLFLVAAAVVLYFVFGIGQHKITHYYVPEQFRSSFPPDVVKKMNGL